MIINLYISQRPALALLFINIYEPISLKLALKNKEYLGNWKIDYLYVPDGSFKSTV